MKLAVTILLATFSWELVSFQQLINIIWIDDLIRVNSSDFGLNSSDFGSSSSDFGLCSSDFGNSRCGQRCGWTTTTTTTTTTTSTHSKGLMIYFK